MNLRFTSCIFFGSLLLLICPLLYGQQYIPVDKGCKVEFKVAKHKSDERIRGTLNNLKGKITFDPQHLSTASFDIAVSAAGISTGTKDLDNDLKKEPYFNIIKYPLVKIKSTSVTQDRPGGKIYILHGNLTVKGITKPVNLQFLVSPYGNAYLFRGTLELSRQAFNLSTKGDGAEDLVSVFIEVRTKKAGN